MLPRAARSRSAKGDAKGSIEYALGVLDDPTPPMQQKFDVALGPELFHAMEEAQEREGATRAREADHRSRSTA